MERQDNQWCIDSLPDTIIASLSDIASAFRRGEIPRDDCELSGSRSCIGIEMTSDGCGDKFVFRLHRINSMNFDWFERRQRWKSYAELYCISTCVICVQYVQLRQRKSCSPCAFWFQQLSYRTTEHWGEHILIKLRWRKLTQKRCVQCQWKFCVS